MDEHVVAVLDARARHQRAIARRRRHEQTGSFRIGPVAGHGQQSHLFDSGLCGEGALRGTKDARAHRETGPGGAGGRGEHDAGELGSRNPGKS